MDEDKVMEQMDDEIQMAHEGPSSAMAEFLKEETPEAVDKVVEELKEEEADDIPAEDTVVDDIPDNTEVDETPDLEELYATAESVGFSREEAEEMGDKLPLVLSKYVAQYKPEPEPEPEPEPIEIPEKANIDKLVEDGEISEEIGAKLKADLDSVYAANEQVEAKNQSLETKIQDTQAEASLRRFDGYVSELTEVNEAAKTELGVGGTRDKKAIDDSQYENRKVIADVYRGILNENEGWGDPAKEKAAFNIAKAVNAKITNQTFKSKLKKQSDKHKGAMMNQSDSTAKPAVSDPRSEFVAEHARILGRATQ